MKHIFRLVVIVPMLLILFGVSAAVVSAEASASQFAIGCSLFSASGSSDAPFVTIYAENESNSSYAFDVVPVTGGHYSGLVSYPAASKGTVFDVEVWGSENLYSSFSDPGYYDGGAYFEKASPCTPNAAICTYPLPDGSVVYDVPLGAPAFFAADLKTQLSFNLPVGTWEISEFSGDFAKVWIACEATPIWIPKNSIGAPVG